MIYKFIQGEKVGLININDIDAIKTTDARRPDAQRSYAPLKSEASLFKQGGDFELAKIKRDNT